MAFIKLSAIGKIFCNCKGFEKSQFYKINEELRCGDLVFKQTFQLDFVQHVQQCGDNSRVATNQKRHLIKQIRYMSLIEGQKSVRVAPHHCGIAATTCSQKGYQCD